MKVIHYIGSLGFGGIERLVYDLVCQQNRREDIETAIGVGNLRGEFKDQFERLNTQLLDFNLNSGFDISPLKIFKIFRSFRKNDVIHLHGFHLGVCIAALLALRPIVYTEHGNFGFGRKTNWTDRISFFFRKLFFKHPNVLICANSHFTEQFLIKNFTSDRKVKTVYNGIFLSKKINEDLLNDLKKQFYNQLIIGTTSRLAGFKRVDRLIEVFSEYIVDNKDAVLIIVGDGPEKPYLMSMVSKLRIDSKVFFLGYQHEISTYQSLFDISIFPSQKEPFGLVALECLDRRKPVLVFKDGGGICEIVKKFEPRDICKDSSEMIERLKHYATNSFNWDYQKQKDLEYFGIERMERDYFNQYKQN